MEKGEASLIVLILLISLVIMLGTGTYIFIKKFTSERIDEVDSDDVCSDITIKIIDACYTETQLKIKVESQSAKKIDKGFLIKVSGQIEELLPTGPFTELEGFNIEELIIPYGAKEGEINEVNLIPKIQREDGSQVVCSIKSEKHVLSTCK